MSFGECVSVNSPMPLVTHRVYRDKDGHKIMTIEVPATLVGHLGARKLQEILQQAQRGLDQRKRASALKAEIIDRLERNEACPSIAKALGCTAAYVRHIRKTLRT